MLLAAVVRRCRALCSVVSVAMVVGSGLVAGCSPAGQRSATEVPQDCVDVSPGQRIQKQSRPDMAAGPKDLANHPEAASGFRAGMRAVNTDRYMAVTANPLASKAACEVLRSGGTALDALVAAQAVLGLTEPQSSGIGGGAFLLYYDASRRALQAYDGRETAPKAATPNYLRWISDKERAEPKPNARVSGRSIGVPGVLRLLANAHAEYGIKPWRELFDPAISLANNGFQISPRMAEVLAPEAENVRRDAESSAYLLHPDGTVKKAGDFLTNPAYAKTLGAIATDGADALYTGAIAQDVVDAVARSDNGRTPGAMTLADLAGYQVKKRTAICVSYRDHQVCGMPPPSAGGNTVAQTLGILSHFDLASMPPTNTATDGGIPTAEAVQLVSDAERLAYADRDKYLADPDFVTPPAGILSSNYLTQRAKLIDLDRSLGVAPAGDLGPVQFAVAPDTEHGTSQITIVDAQGNAASMTTTIEAAFGSLHMVDGFFLNNQLTDFSQQPTDSENHPIANLIQPGKRPRSSMAPTIIFGPGGPQSGQLQYVLGSPGGSTIIQYVVKTIIALIDWGLDPQQAVSMIDFGATNTPHTNIGGEHPLVGPDSPLITALRQRGHTLNTEPQISGLSVIQRTATNWQGGADPRREGVVMGDNERPK